MDYQKIYDDLILFRKRNLPKGYIEKHHIKMRSLGGSDDEANIVSLTGREHYIAHLLLHKILKCTESAYALWMMQCRSGENPRIRTSKMYEWARKEFSKYISKNNRITSKGTRNSQFGSRWICNIDLKQNKKISNNDVIPNGWVLGRNKWNVKVNLDRYKRQEKDKYLSDLYEDFLREGTSVRDFAKKHNLSHPTLYTNWKRLNKAA